MDHLTDPLLLLFLLVRGMLVGLWRGRICPRRWLGLVTVVVAGLAAVSTPAVVFLLLGSLEWGYPPGGERPADAQAIVVLSSSLRALDAEWDRFELGQETLYRCLQGVEIYRQGGRCLVIVSGGKVSMDRSGPTLARAMATFLVEQGIAEDDLVLEERSRSTHENAVESARLLRPRGIGKVVLVTDATHLWRAERCFRAQGIEVVPRGSYYRANYFGGSLKSFLPSVEAAHDTKVVLHEWLGMAWYWLRGWV
jgi:uncharacterized SAM-binding protein YcdF (DUF218 family)